MPSQNLEMTDISTRMAIAFTSRPPDYPQTLPQKRPFLKCLFTYDSAYGLTANWLPTG